MSSILGYHGFAWQLPFVASGGELTGTLGYHGYAWQLPILGPTGGANPPLAMGGPYIAIVGTSEPLPFYMVLASDHTTPALGLHPAVWVSKNGGAFTPAAGAVSELGNGWYQIAGRTTDTSTVGPLWMDVPAVGDSDPVSVRYEVVSAAGVCPVVVGTNKYPMTWLMVSSTDHITGVPSLSPTVLLHKVGGSFAAPAGSIVEIGSDGPSGAPGRGRGVYKLTPNATDFNTAGPLLLHATASGCDDTDQKFDVVGTSILGLIDRLTLAMLAVKATLVNSGIFTNSSCVVSLVPDPFPTPSPPCAWIMPEPDPTNDPLVTGGGRYSTVVRFSFSVNIVVRRLSDIESTDVSVLTNPNRGLYPKVFAVINALNEQFLFDLAGHDLTTCGLKNPTIGMPRRYGSDGMMAVIPISFWTNVLLNLQLPNPT